MCIHGRSMPLVTRVASGDHQASLTAWVPSPAGRRDAPCDGDRHGRLVPGHGVARPAPGASWPEDIGALEGFSSSRFSPLTITIAGAIASAVAVAGLVALGIRFRRVSRSGMPVPLVGAEAVAAHRSSDPLRYIAASERPRLDDDRR